MTNLANANYEGLNQPVANYRVMRKAILPLSLFFFPLFGGWYYGHAYRADRRIEMMSIT